MPSVMIVTHRVLRMLVRVCHVTVLIISHVPYEVWDVNSLGKVFQVQTKINRLSIVFARHSIHHQEGARHSIDDSRL